MAWFSGQGQSYLPRRFRWIWALGMLSLVPLSDTQGISIQARYDRATHLLLQGDVERCQKEADLDYQSLATQNPQWASRFRLVEAQAMLQRGMYGDTLRAIRNYHPVDSDGESQVTELTVESVALMRQEQIKAADQRLAQASSLCVSHAYRSCGELLRARALLAAQKNDLADAKKLFLQTLAFAQDHHDDFLRASATVNLGWIAMQFGLFDEALEWSLTAKRVSAEIGAQGLEEKSAGNLGWAYFNLGDNERALQIFLQSAKSAAKRGDPRSQLGWLATAGYVYRDTGDLDRAAGLVKESLSLARQIDSKEDIVNSLDDLADLSTDAGRYDDAVSYINQAMPLVRADADRVDELDLMLAQGRIAAANHHDDAADSTLRMVDGDPESQGSMRISAEHERAKLYSRQGKKLEADRMYKVALASFESERAQLKSEESELPFFNNAKTLYEDYVSFLVAQGKTEEALQVADWSRARTLAEGLGLSAHTQLFKPAKLELAQIAIRTKSTLLFYWLGREQSYLWAVTPKKTAIYTLPSEKAIGAVARRYQSELLDPADDEQGRNQDGDALYRTLVAPAQALLSSSPRVVILDDGVLSRLNFETLMVSDPHPHYWIEDVTLVSAPSLHMLAAAPSPGAEKRAVLLMGNPVSADADYPELPMASLEMKQVARHFQAGSVSTFSRNAATPAAYFHSRPQNYPYIHFVAHGIASRLDPLDSAIILSSSNTDSKSFKLYARDIIRYPINARLVTLSACTSGGARSYVGEGLVGLSWAFLRAGAHNVIGALWEVSDASTPRLMDELYGGIARGLAPSDALRQAKLALLHSRGSVSRPFFWAPFQIYGGR